MKKIKVRLTLFDYWNVSSGLSSGMDADSLVVKHDGLPLLPGRTFKGLLKDAFKSLKDVKEYGFTDDNINALFGGKEGDQETPSCYFSDIAIEKAVAEELKSLKIQDYLFSAMAFTAMEKDQSVRQNSLRKVEFAKPISLVGEINNIPETVPNAELLFKKALEFIKRLGTSRTRGFGRCQFQIHK